MREVGPLLRTMRRQPGVLALVVLELAAGVTTIGSLLISGSWYGDSGSRPSGLDETNLILLSTYTPSPGGAASTAEGTMLAGRRAWRQRIRGTPGVLAATQVTNTILDDRWSYPSILTVRAAGAAPSSRPAVRDAVGWTSYGDGEMPRGLGLHFVAGGPPAPGANLDGESPRPVGAVLTRCLARRLFGDAAASVGARLSSASFAGVPITGVVDDVSTRSPMVPDSACTVFLFGGAPHEHDARVVARVAPGRRTEALAALRASFADESRRGQVQIRPFDSLDSVHHHIGSGLLLLLGIFGGLVALVALLGALAATSFLVAQRTRQIGIRRALGATRGDIVAYFLFESAIAAAIGSLIGVASTYGLFLLMRRVFHGIQFRAGSVAIALGALWLGSILATLIPALHAARVSPNVAGRSL